MDDFKTHNDDDIEQRLQADRPQMSPIELDRSKQRAMASAARKSRARMPLRARLLAGALAIGLVATGGGAVLAASGGSSSHGSAANSQYCPPSSPGAGKPKHQGGGNKCGQPDGGNGGDQGNGNGQGHGH